MPAAAALPPFSPFSPQFRLDPYSLYRRYREREPVHWGSQTAPGVALEDPDRFPGSHWFAEARLNFAENLLRYRDDRTAMPIERFMERIDPSTRGEVERARQAFLGQLPLAAFMVAYALFGLWLLASPRGA